MEKRFFDLLETGLRSWFEEKLLCLLPKKGDVGEFSVGEAYCLMGVMGGEDVSMIGVLWRGIERRFGGSRVL